MKLTDQNIPSELRASYYTFLSPDEKRLLSQVKVRTRKRVKKTTTPNQRRKRTKADIYAVMVKGLAHSFGKTANDGQDRSWRSDRLAELMAGVVNLTYWMPLYPTHQAIWECTPLSVRDDTPKPYLYRIDENLPTNATYFDGELVVATEDGEWIDDPPPMSYVGSSSDLLFHDDNLIWKTAAFELPGEAGPPNQYPILVCPVLDFTIKADARGSRSMFSYFWNLTPLNAEPDITTTGACVIPGTKSVYWRYQPPTGEAPYYHATAARHDLIVPFKNNAQYRKRWFLLTLSPRPMLGHGFNNNTQVSITVTDDSRLYVPKRTEKIWRTPCFNRPLGVVRLMSYDLSTYTDWDMTKATHQSYERPANYGDKIRSFIGGMVVTHPDAPLAGVWRVGNYMEPLPRNIDVKVLGSYHDGMILANGITINPAGHEEQQLYYSSAHGNYAPIAHGTPQQMAPFVAMEFVGGFANGMIVNDAGLAMNLHLSSITTPSFTGNGTPPVFWNDALYRQGPDGQWWKFNAPANNGGTFDNTVSGSTWAPVAKHGTPTPQPGRAWPCAIGIMLPRPFGSATTHHLLTWEGGLREFNLLGVNDSDYFGSI